MNEAMQEGLDQCETSSSYKGASFQPSFTLLWTNWLLLYVLVTVTLVNCAALLAGFCIISLILMQLIPSTEIKTNYHPHCLGLGNYKA
jgi:hypothetical protein